MCSKTTRRIAEAMEKREVSKAELSRRTGISNSSLSEYLTGKHEPRQDKIYLISKALNVSPMWLMGFDEKEEDDSQKIDIKDLINSAIFLFDGNDYSLNKADREMLTNIMKTVLQGKEIK